MEGMRRAATSDLLMGMCSSSAPNDSRAHAAQPGHDRQRFTAAVGV